MLYTFARVLGNYLAARRHISFANFANVWDATRHLKLPTVNFHGLGSRCASLPVCLNQPAHSVRCFQTGDREASGRQSIRWQWRMNDQEQQQHGCGQNSIDADLSFPQGWKTTFRGRKLRLSRSPSGSSAWSFCISCFFFWYHAVIAYLRQKQDHEPYLLRSTQLSFKNCSFQRALSEARSVIWASTQAAHFSVGTTKIKWINNQNWNLLHWVNMIAAGQLMACIKKSAINSECSKDKQLSENIPRGSMTTFKRRKRPVDWRWGV